MSREDTGFDSFVTFGGGDGVEHGPSARPFSGGGVKISLLESTVNVLIYSKAKNAYIIESEPQPEV
jgi:hypothetical protein